MPGSNKSGEPSKLIIWQCGQMRKMQRHFPFGQDLSDSVLGRFTGLCIRLEDGSPELPHDRALMQRCTRVYEAFAEWQGWDRLTWISCNQKLLQDMVRFLNRKFSPKTYPMYCTECIKWASEVFSLIKTMASRWNGRRRQLLEGQTCVDALYELLSDSIVPPDLLMECRKLMADICQSTALSPTPFILEIKAIKNEEATGVHGGSATVYHGYYDEQEVAIKDFRLYEKTINRVKKRFMNEAVLLQSLRHPNVVPFVGITVMPRQLRLISKWMKHGDIVGYLKKNPDVSKVDLMAQVADALHFLSQRNVVHGDLKGENVLVDDSGKACVADFGLSSYDDPAVRLQTPTAVTEQIRVKYNMALREVGMPESLSTTISSAAASSTLSSFSGAGTFRWMSPERLRPELYGRKSAKPTFQSDVFSFGMLICQVYTGFKPFHVVNDVQALGKIIMGHRPTPRPPKITDELWSLTEKCWSEHATDRPDIGDIYNQLAVMEIFD